MRLTILFKIKIIALILLASHQVYSKQPHNFHEAKKAAKAIWQEHRETFYCGCKYSRKGIIDTKKCRYTPKDKRKAKSINWEHIVPVSWYGQTLSCWDDRSCYTTRRKKLKGRACCREKDMGFNLMEGDLHNIVPEIPEVNSARKNYAFGEFYLKNKLPEHYFQQCQLIIDRRYRIVEPRDEVKGMVARIHLYMAQKYQISLSKEQEKILREWHERFPSSDWEKKWNRKVAQIQGDLNPYIG